MDLGQGCCLFMSGVDRELEEGPRSRGVPPPPPPLIQQTKLNGRERGGTPMARLEQPLVDRCGTITVAPALTHRRQRKRRSRIQLWLLERAFDRLNPDYGVPADTHNSYGLQALRDREAALALGTRVAVAASRENDPNPVMWLAGQDYRAADATHRARVQAIRQRHGPERLGPER
jgi:hypothetical protein